MVQPAVRITSMQEARAAARALESPSEVADFRQIMTTAAPEVRAFLDTEEWAEIRGRIMGSETPPMGRPTSLAELSRRIRWTADGYFSEEDLPEEARRAYLFCAGEIDAYDRAARRAAPVSPAGAVAAPDVTPVDVYAQPEPGALVGFADALRAVQAGAHVARVSWAPGEYVTAQAGYPDGIAVNENTSRATGLEVGTTAVFLPYLLRRLAPRPAGVENGEFVDGPPEFEHWLPGQADLFATDWRVLRRPR